MVASDRRLSWHSGSTMAVQRTLRVSSDCVWLSLDPTRTASYSIPRQSLRTPDSPSSTVRMIAHRVGHYNKIAETARPASPDGDTFNRGQLPPLSRTAYYLSNASETAQPYALHLDGRCVMLV